MTTNTNSNGLMGTLARWQRATNQLAARGIDVGRLGQGVAAALAEHASPVGPSERSLEALVLILEAVDAVLGASAIVSSTPVPAPRVETVAPVVAVAPVATVAPPAAPVATAPAAVAAPSTPIAPATPAEIEGAFAAQIVGARSLRELATLGVKVARAGLPKDATDRLQAAYQARKAVLGGKGPVLPTAPQPAPAPRGAVPAPSGPPAAPTPASGPVAALGGALGGAVAAQSTPAAAATAAMSSHRWVAARFFPGGGRQILGYVSGDTDVAAIGAAEAKWGTGVGVGVMDLAVCSALELAEADKAVGRAAPAGVGGNSGGGGKRISVEMPVGFTVDPDAQEEV